MSRGYFHTISNLNTYIAISPADMATDIDNICVASNIDRPDITKLTLLLQNVLGCFYNNGIVVCVRSDSRKDYISRSYGSSTFRWYLKLRSSINNTYNAFAIGLNITYKLTEPDHLFIEGSSVEKWEMTGNKIRITNGRRTIFQTHGKANSWNEWNYITDDTNISGLATYLTKRYHNNIIENANAAKQYNNKMKLRELELDEVRSLCDILSNEDRNIFAHFYDSGKDYGSNHFRIIINNRNDYQDLPSDTFQWRECTKENPCELASLKYFKDETYINIEIEKVSNENNEGYYWKINIGYPLTNYLVKILNYNFKSFKSYNSLTDFANEFLILLDNDFNFCQKMNNICYYFLSDLNVINCYF